MVPMGKLKEVKPDRQGIGMRKLIGIWIRIGIWIGSIDMDRGVEVDKYSDTDRDMGMGIMVWIWMRIGIQIGIRTGI